MTSTSPIYLDNAASTPCAVRVIEAMTPYFAGAYGNPAGRHAFANEAGAAVERARKQVASLLGATSPADEIIFTAGATESNNLAIKGVVRGRAQARAAAGASARGHIITSAVEHKAVLQPCHRLEQEGFDVTRLTPTPSGVITDAMVGEALRPDTLLVSIIWANNEIGSISDIAAIGRVCRASNVLLHTDATQLLGLLPVDVEAASIDLLSFSGHKISGPKGVGALFVRGGEPTIALQPVIEGGSHERGLRAGTLNVPGIVGLGEACALCESTMHEEGPRLAALRDHLESELTARLGDVIINGGEGERVPHVSNLCFPAIAGTPLIDHVIDEIACSSGSAIGTDGRKPSHVLAALGVSADIAATSLRLSLGRTTSRDDIDRTVQIIASTVQRLSPTAAARGG